MQARRKIAVAGATGRVGRHVVEVLEAAGHDVVAMSRASGVDVVSGMGLAEALAGVECVIDVVTGPSPEEQAATEFFPRRHPEPAEAAPQRRRSADRRGVHHRVRPVHRGVRRGEGRPRAGHAGGPDPRAYPARRRSSTSSWRARGMGQAGRRELRAEDAHPAGRRQNGRRGARRPRHRIRAGRPRLEHRPRRSPGRGRKAWSRWRDSLMARRGDPVRIEDVRDPADFGYGPIETSGLLPGPHATLAGPTFEGVARRHVVMCMSER